MQESLITDVVVGEGEEKKLEMRLDGEVLVFYLENKQIFRGDWFNNFKDMFERALEIWKEPIIQTDE